jgi:hypothetical protein
MVHFEGSTRIFCSAPRPRPGRHFLAPRAPGAPAPRPTVGIWLLVHCDMTYIIVIWQHMPSNDETDPCTCCVTVTGRVRLARHGHSPSHMPRGFSYCHVTSYDVRVICFSSGVISWFSHGLHWYTPGPVQEITCLRLGRYSMMTVIHHPSLELEPCAILLVVHLGVRPKKITWHIRHYPILTYLIHTYE